MSMYTKSFLDFYTAFSRLRHILWEGTTPPINLTDNNLVTRFFQEKAIALSVWNARD